MSYLKSMFNTFSGSQRVPKLRQETFEITDLENVIIRNKIKFLGCTTTCSNRIGRNKS